ncbi:MAG: hypothetical protein DI556_10695 [Rhodovulum sulfidophilum]|uniref:Methylamine utilization protein MauE n=1 Tax=Rhodovulum sulfidophilum TaxID=35806 RepID=A0A2W5N8W4_RHOSU|nr:MAG: hypothetical protein DI556_10695 [Rhodovulum sulfidophilum]
MDGATLTGGTLTVFLAALLLRAAWHKSQAFLETTGFVADYGVAPPGREALATRAVIAAEALLLVALILPATRALGAAGTAVLLLGYAWAMAGALRRGQRRIDCGCGGAPQFVSALTIARNLVLAALALALAFLPAGGAGVAGAALAVAGGLTLWCLYAIIERLLANAGHIRLAADQS